VAGYFFHPWLRRAVARRPRRHARHVLQDAISAIASLLGIAAGLFGIAIMRGVGVVRNGAGEDAAWAAAAPGARRPCGRRHGVLTPR